MRWWLVATTTALRCMAVAPFHAWRRPSLLAPTTLSAVAASSSSLVDGGAVYFVATPIGNLDDITVRARDVLARADVIAAEDTRRTGRLLQHLGLPNRTLVSHHEHNWKRRIPELVSQARGGLHVAVVSDAGTPGIADPGRQLAEACAEAGVPVVPIPGACAAVAAVSITGFDCAEFVFFGFLPPKGSELKAKVQQIARERRTCVFYEAPHRVADTFARLAALDDARGRQVVVARELTKLHEELHRGTVASTAEWLATSPARGEFTVVLGPSGQAHNDTAALLEEAVATVAQLIDRGEPLSSAVRQVSADFDVPKNKLYKRALALSNPPAP